MRNLGDMVARLTPKTTGTTPTSRLTPVAIIGPNPGALKAWCHIPARRSAAPALVVVLHGCTQTAAGYDAGSGWSKLADRHGFVVLYAEQQRANNPGLCFNWYAPDDIKRGRGEAGSIRSAFETITLQQGIDPSRVFITGLSAGGAMTSVMLATYPEVFAAGAIIAGLPFGCATTVPEAFDRVRGVGLPAPAAAASAVHKASSHRGPWPEISIWHGTADTTVVPSNADALVEQWRGVDKLGPAPDQTETASTHTRRAWSDASGRPRLEDYRVRGMGHGVAIDPKGQNASGQAGPFMLDVGLSSTARLVEMWGLADAVPEQTTVPEDGFEQVRSASALAT